MVQCTESWAGMLEAQAIIDKAFPRCSRVLKKVTELPSGPCNTYYLLTLTDNCNYVLKISPPSDVRVLRYESSISDAEVTTLSLVKEKTTVPVPEVILHDDTYTILDSPYILMTYIPGITLNTIRHTLTRSQSDSIDRTIGSYVRQLNSIHSDYFGLAPKLARKYKSWQETFLVLTEAVLRDAEDMLVLLPYEHLRQQLRKTAYTLDGISVPRLSMMDFGDGSVLVDPSSMEVIGLIDLERSGWVDPLMSAVFRNPTPGFMDGYGGVADSNWRRCRALMYSCYFSTIKIVEAYYHQFGSDQEMKERRRLVQCLEALANWKDE